MNSNQTQQLRLPPLKKFLFVAFFFFLILLLLELLLSFIGLEKYDNKFAPKSNYPVFVQGKVEKSGYYVTNPHFGTYINTQSFLREKPAGLTRIFVIGGSAAYGFPYSEEYGFSGYLRRALDRASPGRFEVVNASGMSFGSHRVLDILKDIVLFEPDIVIVYSGNNEYVEQNILPELKKPSPALEKVSSFFSDTDIYRALRLSLLKVAPGVFERQIKNDITDIRSTPKVSRGNIGRSSNTDSTILANYRNNITAMQEKLVQHGVKVIFATVPVDIGGWIPQSGLPHFTDETAARKWLDLIELRDEAFRAGNIQKEAEYMQKILEITPDDPGMLFNYGKILWILGKYNASYQALIRAKDLDYRPIRALSPFNEVIRTTADKRRGAYVADLASMYREKYFKGQAKDIFLDYCHLTEEGNKLVAQWLLPILDETLPSYQLNKPLLSQLIREDARADTKSDFVRGHELYAKGLTLENNGRFDQAEQTYLQALNYLPQFGHIYTNLGHIYVDQNNYEKALEMYTKALQINPDNHKVLLSLGYMNIQQGKYDQAENFFARAIQMSSALPGAYAGLGDIAMQRGRYRDAINYYNDSLRLGQDSVWLRKSLAKAYISLGDKANAVGNLKEALKFNPLDQNVKAQIQEYSK